MLWNCAAHQPSLSTYSSICTKGLVNCFEMGIDLDTEALGLVVEETDQGWTCVSRRVDRPRIGTESRNEKI